MGFCIKAKTMCNAGTVAYVGPEVLQRGAIAMPADVYSFAMLLMELWTGDIMYKGINYHQVSELLPSHGMPILPSPLTVDPAWFCSSAQHVLSVDVAALAHAPSSQRPLR
jgi:hypothetical protein